MRKKILKKLTVSSLWAYIELEAMNTISNLIKFIFIESLCRIVAFGDVDLKRTVLDELSEKISAA